MYEFVSKKEYAPIRKEIESIIKNVQHILRNEDKDLTFQFSLVGSGKRHLITRIKNGNSGYDFDYNLALNQKFSWRPFVRESFFKAFQQAIKGTRFNAIENSTSVITIKQVSQKEKTVLVGCDFSIIVSEFDNNEKYYKYSRLNKNLQNYTWEIRNCSRQNESKINFLLNNYLNAWNFIKNEYLKLKENDRQKKHSFILFYEAVNNVYNFMLEDKEE